MQSIQVKIGCPAGSFHQEMLVLSLEESTHLLFYPDADGDDVPDGDPEVLLEGFGLEVVERVPLEVTPNPHNVRYLKTKREKMGHLLADEGLA